MRVLLIAALLVSMPAAAEWVKYGESSGVTHYLDPSIVQEDGHLRRFEALQDLEQRSKAGALSMRSVHEYDCEQKRTRFLSAKIYSERMGGGTILRSGDINGEWGDIGPGTVAEEALGIVCR